MELYEQIIWLFDQGASIEQIAQQLSVGYQQVVEAIELAQQEFDQQAGYEYA